MYSIGKICNEHGLSTEEELVASQIVKHLEKKEDSNVKAAVINANIINPDIINPDRSEEYLFDAFKLSIKDIEDSITEDDTDETKYIKREYIRIMKSFIDKPKRLKEIYRCVQEYYKQK